MNNSTNLRLGFISEGKLLVKFAFVPGQAAEIVVGRSSNSQICINNNVISGQHAQFIFDQNNNLFVIDLNSSNGTFLNDKRIESGVPYGIQSTDRLCLSSNSGIELVFNPDSYQMAKENRQSIAEKIGRAHV